MQSQYRALQFSASRGKKNSDWNCGSGTCHALIKTGCTGAPAATRRRRKGNNYRTMYYNAKPSAVLRLHVVCLSVRPSVTLVALYVTLVMVSGGFVDLSLWKSMKNVLSKVDLFRNDVERFSIATCKPIKHNWWEVKSGLLDGWYEVFTYHRK